MPAVVEPVLLSGLLSIRFCPEPHVLFQRPGIVTQNVTFAIGAFTLWLYSHPGQRLGAREKVKLDLTQGDISSTSYLT